MNVGSSVQSYNPLLVHKGMLKSSQPIQFPKIEQNSKLPENFGNVFWSGQEFFSTHVYIYMCVNIVRKQ